MLLAAGSMIPNHTRVNPLSRTRQQYRHLGHLLQRPHYIKSSSSGSSNIFPSVPAEEAKRLIEREGYKILDIRSAKEFDHGHITKPTRCCISAPAYLNDGVTPDKHFINTMAAAAPHTTAKLIVMCADGGGWSEEALQQLAAAAYTTVVKLQGGYQGWSQVWSPSGKRRPPPGRWVSTGKEALKSGLNIPGVAESYDEGGNLTNARYAKGLQDGQSLL